MSYKDTNISNPGTSIKYGADDLEKISRLLNGVTTGVGGPMIKTQEKWGFWDGIVYFRNQADSRTTTIRGQTNVPTTDVELTLPPITGNDTLPAIGLAQTWAALQTYNAGIQHTEMSTPANPSSGKHKMFVNASNGHLQKLNSAGVIKDYDITAATVPMDLKDGVLSLRDYDCRIFATGVSPSQTFYAIKYDGTIISTGTNPATVIQTALDTVGPGSFRIDAPYTDAYIHFQAGFTGITVDSYQTIEIGNGTNLNVPQGYTGSLFKLTGSNITIKSNGGYCNEDGTVARNWTAFQVGTATSADDVTACVISGIRFFAVGTCIKINQGSTGKVYANLFEDLSIEDARVSVEFVASNNSSTNENVFRFVNTIKAGSTTDAFKNVAGDRSQFLHCDCIGFTGAQSEMVISSNAVNTMIFGGSCTGVAGTFTDNGTDTLIDDATHSEWKLKSGTITPTALTASVNNWNPSGFNDKTNTIRASSNAEWAITGLTVPVNSKGRMVQIHNVGTNNIMFAAESSSSTAANRFKLNTDLMLMPDQGVLLYYDITSSRWRLVADAGAGHAMLNEPNDFTEYNLFIGDNAALEVQKNDDDLFFLTRDSNTVNAIWGMQYWARDSISAFNQYAGTYAMIAVNTNGAEDGEWFVQAVVDGAMAERLRVYGEPPSDKGSVMITGKSTATDVLTAYRPSNSTNDTLDFNFNHNSSTSVMRTFADIRSTIVTATNAAEDGRLQFNIIRAGTKAETYRFDKDGNITNTLNINTVNTEWGIIFQGLSSTSAVKEYARIRAKLITNTNGAEDAQINHWMMRGGTMVAAQRFYRGGDIDLFKNDSTNFVELSQGWYMLDSGAAEQQYGNIACELISNTAGSEAGQFDFDLVRSGTVQRCYKFDNTGKIFCGRDVSNLRGVPSGNTTSDDIRFVNSSAENTMFSRTVKGSVMGVDGSVEYEAFGYILQNSVTATDYTLRIKVAGTTVYQDVVYTAGAQSATKMPWILKFSVFPSNQSSTTARMVGHWELNDTSGGTTTGQGDASDDEQLGNATIRAEGISWTFANDTTVSVTMQMSTAQSATEWQMDYMRDTYYPS